MRWLIVTSFILHTWVVSAQFSNNGCIDPTRINPFADCSAQPQFYPICGCDNVTYRNLCEAQNRHGILAYVDGPCSGFEFDIRPNMATYSINFTLVQLGNPNFA